MDLHPIKTPATSAEIAAVDSVLGPEPPGGEPTLSAHEARNRRHQLLPALHAAQDRAGWISPGALGYISRRLGVPPAEAYGVASFYALFALERRPPRVVHVCDDIACKASGADALCAELEHTLGPAGTAHGEATWMRSPCLGLCDQAPAAMLSQAGEVPRDALFGHATAALIRDAVEHGRAPARTAVPVYQSRDGLHLLARAGLVDPTNLDDYRAHGGYSALRRAVELGPAGVIREVTDARLVGRGGAAFPTGRKWAAVAAQPVRPHYLVCNADESEPGTFKDRVLMEEDPFALIEAITIAAYATGCERAFIYVRGEYPLATTRLAGAVAQARARGLLGDDVMGRGFRVEVELRRGAGAYICGEETALFNSLEGLRGEPRNKPPFPAEAGLFGKPTVVNNVETLVSVLGIVREGAAAYAARGTSGSTGTRLFCVSGHVARPGVYELPLGTKLSALIELAGGVRAGRKVKTVLLGGAAGTFVTGDELDTPLTQEDTRKIGATLGSGVVLVLDDTTGLLPLLRRLAEFFRDESCGQCVPCRVGTVRQEELLARISRGRPRGGSYDGERVLMKELGQAMRDASICGLGQTASAAIESAIAKLAVLDEPTRAPAGGAA